MTAAPVTTAPVTSTASANAKTDPALLATIGSAGAPAVVPPPVRPPPSVPGTLNPVVGALGLADLARRGVACAVEYPAKYGDVYRVTMGGLPMVGIWDADAIHAILRNEDQAWSTAMGWELFLFDGLDPRGGNAGSLLSLDFDDHRIARKLVQPAFTLRAIESYLETARGRFAETIPTWLARGEVRFKSEVRTLLARVAGEIFTGIRDPERMRVVDRALSDFWFGQLAFVRSPWLSPKFRRARRGLLTLHRVFHDLVAERRREPGADLFSRMCAVTETDGLDDSAIVRVFLTVMAGAFDTTSAALTSMAYLLAKHPAWQERVREEARAVPAGALDVTAMRGMKQLELVWKETLRLFPVASFFPRRALREVTVLGHALPAGTLAMVAAGAIGRHPRWWKAPDTFDPERFGPERAEDRQHPGIYNPFGVGAHACVGMQLAVMEMKAFWHELLRGGRFRLAPDYEARHTAAPMGIVSGDVRLVFEPAT